MEDIKQDITDNQSKISSNRSWAYTGENCFSPTASKLHPLHNPTTICKGTDHCLMSKMNVYPKAIQIYIGIYYILVILFWIPDCILINFG